MGDVEIDQKSQGKMKTMLMQNCLRVLGGKKHAIKVYYGGCGYREFKLAVCVFRL